MNEEYFRELSRKVLVLLQSVHNSFLNDQLINDIKKIQNFMWKNPDNSAVQEFRFRVFLFYYELFTNAELVRACNLPDCFYFHKQIEVFKNLPFTRNIFLGEHICQIFVIPTTSYGSFYSAFFEILKEYSPDQVNHPYFQYLAQFIAQNAKIIHSGKDNYYDMATEVYFHNLASIRTDFEDIKTYGCNYNINKEDKDKLRIGYQNKKRGNIGEIFAYNQIANSYQSCFVARDLANGFGYDIFYFDTNGENLVEVKTTTGSKDNDSFSISNNEYQIMLSCLNNPFANYMVDRVYIDNLLNPCFHAMLVMQNAEVLIGKHDSSISYELSYSSDNENIFRKRTIFR